MKKILSGFFALLLIVNSGLWVTAAPLADQAKEDLQAPFVLDEAELLTAKEEKALKKQLEELSEEYEVQVAVAILEEIDQSDIEEFSADFYDDMEYGYGRDRDGVLLLVSMDSREFQIVSMGVGQQAIGEKEAGKIVEKIQPRMEDDQYAAAFEIFAEQCEYYIDGHINGFPFNVGKSLVIALIVGAVIGVVVVLILKGQLKTVRKQNQANAYVKAGSMQITQASDFFLYRNLVVKEKEQNKSSSDFGRPRSVGGGSF